MDKLPDLCDRRGRFDGPEHLVRPASALRANSRRKDLMSRRSKRLRAPALLIVALAALLVFAATASAAAETRTGESTTASTEEAPSGEALLVNTTASFET